MRLFLRVLAHIGLCALYVYVFYFATPLLGSSWPNWIWTIATGIIILFSFFILYSYFDSVRVFHKESASARQELVAGILAEALITVSLTCKIIEYNLEDVGFLLLPVLLCMLYSGINKYFLSFIFMFASILYYVNYVEFSSWHSYTLLICLIITHIVIIFSLGNKMGTDNDLHLNRLGLLIIPIIIVYMINSGTMELLTQTSTQKIILLVYILLGFSVSVSDNIIVYAFSPLIIMTYGVFLFLQWDSLYSWLIIILCISYSVLFYISYKSFKSTAHSIIAYLFNENQNLKKNYEELISIINQRSRQSTRNGSGNYGNVKTGFWRGVGHFLADTITEILKNPVG